MKAIDESRLETDLEYRYQYLAEFIGFGPDDQTAIQMSAMYLGPMIPELVDATYARLPRPASPFRAFSRLLVARYSL